MLKKFTIGILSLVFIIFALGMWVANLSDNRRNAELASTTSPQRLAELIINEPKASPSVTVDKGAYKISYDADPWALTHGTTRMIGLNFVAQLIPAFFEKFHDARTVEVTATGTFVDLKGNESKGRVIDVTFSRDNAATTHFDKMTKDNIPKIADNYWEHRSLRN